MHTFNPKTWGADTVDLCVFEASLLYVESSRPARATERERERLCLKTNTLYKEITDML